MATVIRMQRGGRTHKPYYRIVVMDSRSRTRGVEVDTLGIYHPCARPEPVAEVDIHKALEWLSKGASPSAYPARRNGIHLSPMAPVTCVSGGEYSTRTLVSGSRTGA